MNPNPLSWLKKETMPSRISSPSIFSFGDAQLNVLSVDLLALLRIGRRVCDVAVLVNVRNHAVVVEAIFFVFSPRQFFGFFLFALLLALQFSFSLDE